MYDPSTLVGSSAPARGTSIRSAALGCQDMAPWPINKAVAIVARVSAIFPWPTAFEMTNNKLDHQAFFVTHYGRHTTSSMTDHAEARVTFPRPFANPETAAPTPPRGSPCQLLSGHPL